MNIDHVAFLVRSLDDAIAELSETDFEVQTRDRFESEGTEECYVGRPGQQARLLLIEAVGPGPYQSALERRGPGLHHIGLTTESLDDFVSELDRSGWYLHPRSLESRANHNTIWLTRPGVGALIEVTEGQSSTEDAVVSSVRVDGLTQRSVTLFDSMDIPVKSGPSAALLSGTWRSFAGAADVPKDVFEYNREAWNAQVADGNKWTVPVSPAEVHAARSGEFSLLLTPKRRVSTEWLGDVNGRDVLCLASGGGQQGPLLAAAGARVTVFDASDAQLERDREVAAREGLSLRTVRGDMRDLSAFEDASFDLIFHPCSNCFVAEILPVWRESFRVLRAGGELLAGFNNPVSYCFDWTTVEKGHPRLAHKLPYADVENLDSPYVAAVLAANEPLEFGHTLTDQIAGQLHAGFQLIDMFEDEWGSGYFPDDYFPGFFATRARKPG